MNKFMTRRAQPNNIQTVFWKVAPMMSVNIMVLLSTILTSIWFYNLASFDGSHNGMIRTYSIHVSLLILSIIFFSSFLSIIAAPIFATIFAKIIGTVLENFICLSLFRTSPFLLSFLSRRRLIIFQATGLTPRKMSIFISTIMIKLVKWFTDMTLVARFHNYLINENSPSEYRGLVSMQPNSKGELKYDFITNWLHRHLHYNTEVNYG